MPRMKVQYGPTLNISISGYPQLQGKLANGKQSWIGYIESEILFKEAESVAEDMQSAIRSQAIWKDRTGEARRSLFAVAIGRGLANAQPVPHAPQPPVPGRKTASRGFARPNGGAAVGAQTDSSYAVVIVAYGEADQNLWLEIAMGSRFAIIGPSLIPWGRTLKDRLEAKLKE